MTNRRTPARNRGVRFVGGSGLLFLSAVTWVVWDGTPMRNMPVAAAQAQASSATYKSVYDGWKWWHVYCYRCHGTNAVATTMAPDLIDPNRRLTSAQFLKIVRDGIPDKGMQAWDKLLDRKQIEEIHLYVRARTDKVLPPGRPDEVGPNGGPWVPPAGWPQR
jgi:mono/diheme cytochrome c family protein